jgi:hypothetical protein
LENIVNFKKPPHYSAKFEKPPLFSSEIAKNPPELHWLLQCPLMLEFILANDISYMRGPLADMTMQ